MRIDPTIDMLGIVSDDFSVTIHAASKGDSTEAGIAQNNFF